MASKQAAPAASAGDKVVQESATQQQNVEGHSHVLGGSHGSHHRQQQQQQHSRGLMSGSMNGMNGAAMPGEWASDKTAYAQFMAPASAWSTAQAPVMAPNGLYPVYSQLVIPGQFSYSPWSPATLDVNGDSDMRRAYAYGGDASWGMAPAQGVPTSSHAQIVYHQTGPMAMHPGMRMRSPTGVEGTQQHTAQQAEQAHAEQDAPVDQLSRMRFSGSASQSRQAQHKAEQHKTKQRPAAAKPKAMSWAAIAGQSRPVQNEDGADDDAPTEDSEKSEASMPAVPPTETNVWDGQGRQGTIGRGRGRGRGHSGPAHGGRGRGSYSQGPQNGYDPGRKRYSYHHKAGATSHQGQQGRSQNSGGAGDAGRSIGAIARSKRYPQRDPAGLLPSDEVLSLIKHDQTTFNPKDFDLKIGKARFFVIKSYSEDDVFTSITNNVWTSTQHGNRRLDNAFQQQKSENGHVYLFFSVNGSGHFCGVAEMVSPCDFSKQSGLWAQDKWKGEFKVKWIFVKDVPNGQFKHITLANNENKPVTNSRDTQEVPFKEGCNVLTLIAEYQNTASVFDDFIAHAETIRIRDEKKKKSKAGPANKDAAKMVENAGAGNQAAPTKA